MAIGAAPERRWPFEVAAAASVAAATARRRDESQKDPQHRQVRAIGGVLRRRPDPLGQRFPGFLGRQCGTSTDHQTGDGQQPEGPSPPPNDHQGAEGHRRERQDDHRDVNDKRVDGQAGDGVEDAGISSEGRHS